MGCGKGDVNKDSIDKANDRKSSDEDELANQNEECNNAPKRQCPSTSIGDSSPSKKACRSTSGDEEQPVDPHVVSIPAPVNHGPSHNMADPSLVNIIADKPEGQIDGVDDENVFMAVENPKNPPLSPPSPQEGNAGAEPVCFVKAKGREYLLVRPSQEGNAAAKRDDFVEADGVTYRLVYPNDSEATDVPRYLSGPRLQQEGNAVVASYDFVAADGQRYKLVPVSFPLLKEEENEEHQDGGASSSSDGERFEENQDDPEPEILNAFSARKIDQQWDQY